MAFAWQPSAFGEEPEELEPIDFEVKFEGTDDQKLLDLLGKITEERLTDDTAPPTSEAGLKQKASEVLPDYLSAMHLRGYYDGLIDVSYKQEEETTQVVYTLQTGKSYRLRSKQYEFIGNKPANINLLDLETLAPKLGARSNVDSLVDGASDIEKHIASNNCYLTVTVDPSIQLDTQTNSVDYFYTITTGPEASFGDVSVSGNEKVNETYIRQLIPLMKGGCFHARDIEKTRTSLLNSNLFATAEIEHGSTPDATGQVPVMVTLKERFHRTIKAGISYMTDQGPGISAGWEHRNFFGGGEKVETRVLVSQLEFSASANYTEPYFYRKDQSLKLGAKIAHEKPEAYTSENIEFTGGVERKIDSNLILGLGAGYRISNVEETSTGDTETFALVYFPAYGQWDSRDDSLNATKGIFARIDTAPYFDTLGSDAYFLRSRATASTYFELPGPLSPVLALRGSFGSITATDTKSVPADLRFYAGGGSSVRGYGYQELGPQKNGDPFGGRSLVETSAELRLKATETIGMVAFLDGGNAFDAPYPDFKQDMQWGAGIGARYYTDFGPLRLDVAVPLNKREGDDAFQLYVSLGQAF